MKTISEISSALVHLFFPHVCAACGSDSLQDDAIICTRCLSSIPYTGFESIPGNPVEKKFWGRLDTVHVSASCYFTKGSIMQQLMHELKYKGNRDLGILLGTLMGRLLLPSPMAEIDAIIPLPLFPARERKRGYNQATLLCEGIASVLNKPVIRNAVMRNTNTSTQTKKGRLERWQNMEGKFLLRRPALLEGKHLLLVDDVITTGATLESCGQALLQVDGVRLSIASLCYANR